MGGESNLCKFNFEKQILKKQNLWNYQIGSYLFTLFVKYYCVYIKYFNYYIYTWNKMCNNRMGEML